MVSKSVGKYSELYKRIERLTDDRKIYPLADTFDFKKLVSERDWFGVPSFDVKDKKEIAKVPHVTLRIRDDKLINISTRSKYLYFTNYGTAC